MFPEEQSKQIHMPLAGSLLPDANRRRTQEEASFIAYRYNMQNVSIYLSPAPMCWTLSTGAAAALFLHPFSKWRDPWCSVAAAAAGWPSFSTPAEIQSFRSALLRWPMGKGRIPSPTRPILLSLIWCLSCSVTRNVGIILMTRTGISVFLQEHYRPLAPLLHCAFVTSLYSMRVR